VIDFAVEADDLGRALGLIKSCVPSRTTMPILSCVLLSATAGKLSIFASSIDMEAEVEIAADVGQDGVVAVHTGVLTEIARKLPKTSTAMLAPAGNEGLLKLACGRSRFNLSTTETEAMPRMKVDGLKKIKVKAAALRWLLDVTGPCAAENGENAWANAGVNLSIEGSTLFGMAYDTKRGAIVEIEFEGETEGLPSVTVPNYAVKQIGQICRTSDDVIELGISKGLIEVRSGTAVFRSRLIDAEFTALSRGNRVKTEEPLFCVSASAFAEVVERVSATFETVPSGVALVASVGVVPGDSGELKVTAGGTRGVNEATDVVMGERIGRFPELALVNRQLLHGLAVFEDRTIEVRQSVPGSPVQFTTPDLRLRYFLAPMTKR
jgi:DNA polymerase-3 subunit beta